MNEFHEQLNRIFQQVNATPKINLDDEERVKARFEKLINRKWDYDISTDYRRKAFRHIMGWLACLLENVGPPRWFTLSGKSSVGKTHLMRQVYFYAEEFWMKKKDGAMKSPICEYILPGRDLLDFKSPSEYSMFDLIYIEDVGAGNNPEKGTGEVLCDRISSLLQNRSRKWTLIDTNFTMEDIKKFLGVRIAERMERDKNRFFDFPSDAKRYHEL